MEAKMERVKMAFGLDDMQEYVEGLILSLELESEIVVWLSLSMHARGSILSLSQCHRHAY